MWRIRVFVHKTIIRDHSLCIRLRLAKKVLENMGVCPQNHY